MSKWVYYSFMSLEAAHGKVNSRGIVEGSIPSILGCELVSGGKLSPLASIEYPVYVSSRTHLRPCGELHIAVSRSISEKRTCMKPDPSPEADRYQDLQEGLLTFPLEGLLPANQTLVLNLSMRTATLLFTPSDGEAQVLSQQRFRPNGMRVLLPLLKAYPGFCTYDVLVASLLSLTLDQARQMLRDSWEVAMRPVRRAISGMMDGLHALGLSVRSLRKAGYILEALSLPHF